MPGSNDSHEGRVFWFNTLLFTNADCARLPGMEPKRLARRASNLILLGLSLPGVIDFSTSSPFDYLRSFYGLLSEYKEYERLHPSDGIPASTFTRARITSVFSRSAPSRNRRTSSATDITLPMQASDATDLKAVSGVPVTGSSFGARDLEPGDDYAFLCTPWIPFEVDFFEVFATLCDMLAEGYSRITTLVSSPQVCYPELIDLFNKTDNRLKEIIFEGVIKEFVDSTRAGVKNELGGISKVVLGGLID